MVGLGRITLIVFVCIASIAAAPADDASARHRAIAQLDIRFRPSVFGRSTFPSCDFDDPAAAAAALLGAYKLHPTFFDNAGKPVTEAVKPETDDSRYPLNHCPVSIRSCTR
jgi:hypothetical protein